MRGRSTANPYGAYYVLQENSTGKSNYNALQASFRVTGWHGVTSIVNYVYSKSLDNSSDGEDFEPNAAQPNDSTQPQSGIRSVELQHSSSLHVELFLRVPEHGWQHAEAEEWLGLEQRRSLCRAASRSS